MAEKTGKKNYTHILFDADETLFLFDAFAGLKHMLAKHQVDITLQEYEEYEAVNKPLWVDYQNGTITSDELQSMRFSFWGTKLNLCPKGLNSSFLDSMADICAPIDGAISLIESLKGKAKLAIITNGFTQLLKIRLERTGLKEHFDVLVISEEFGLAKPDRRIFDHALSLLGNPPREQVLMVGDTAESDILGGMNAELDTCWFNPGMKVAPEHIKPSYQISSLKELEALLTQA